MDDVGELRDGIFSFNEKAGLVGVEFQDVFDFTSETKWTNIETADVRLAIPFSPEWNIASTPLSAFDVGVIPYYYNETEVVMVPFIRFGKFVSSFTYAAREYYLQIVPKDRIISGPITTLQQYAVEQCPFEGVEPPTLVSIGRYSGVTYLYGGSKGCVTDFSSIVRDQVLFLYQRPWRAAGAEGKHEVPKKMRKIIESIRLK